MARDTTFAPQMIPILDKLINLEVEDNESYTKCKELACNVRTRLQACKEKPNDVALGRRPTQALPASASASE